MIARCLVPMTRAIAKDKDVFPYLWYAGLRERPVRGTQVPFKPGLLVHHLRKVYLSVFLLCLLWHGGEGGGKNS